MSKTHWIVPVDIDKDVHIQAEKRLNSQALTALIEMLRMCQKVVSRANKLSEYAGLFKDDD